MFKYAFVRGLPDCNMQAGTSVLAALVLAAVLGGMALVIDGISPSHAQLPNNSSQLAQAVSSDLSKDAGIDDIGKEQKDAANSIAKKCEEAIKAAKAGQTTATSKGGGIVKDEDNCVAAYHVPNDPTYKSTGGYKCVGKSASVNLLTSGASAGEIQIKGAPDPNMEPGKCAVVACVPKSTNLNAYVELGLSLPSSLVGASNLKTGSMLCAPANMTSIDKSQIVNLLNTSSKSFDVPPSGGALIPSSPLSKSDNDILNQVFGRSSNNTSGQIPISGTGLAAPPEARIRQLAEANPNAEAQAAQQAVFKATCEANPPLCGPVATQRSPVPPPADAAARAAAEAAARAQAEAVARAAAGRTGFVDATNRSATGGSSMLNGLLQALTRGLMQQPPPQPPQQPPQQCGTDPNAQQQQLQQYQYQMQQYNYQLQLYNQQRYQQQLQQQMMGGGLGLDYGLGLGGFGAQPPAPQPPQPCTPSTQSQCQNQVPPPNPAACTAGSWMPQYQGACIVQWHCVPRPVAQNPQANISCQPAVADVGMNVAITYSCVNATSSEGAGFSTGGKLAGSATAVVVAPQEGNTVIYGITCKREQQTVTEQCKVEVSKPSIVLIANPREVVRGEKSTIGWVTAGMRSCIISSQDMPEFTERNASNTSVNGMATTDSILSEVTVTLKCTTLGGGTKSATATVSPK